MCVKIIIAPSTPSRPKPPQRSSPTIHTAPDQHPRQTQNATNTSTTLHDLPPSPSRSPYKKNGFQTSDALFRSSSDVKPREEPSVESVAIYMHPKPHADPTDERIRSPRHSPHVTNPHRSRYQRKKYARGGIMNRRKTVLLGLRPARAASSRVQIRLPAFPAHGSLVAIAPRSRCVREKRPRRDLNHGHSTRFARSVP
jgi:hypothetical protein